MNIRAKNNKIGYTSAMAMLVLSLNACSSTSESATQWETDTAAESIAALNGAPENGSHSIEGQQTSLPAAMGTVISPQDTLDINVFKVPDLSATSIIVESNGLISLPLAGSVKVGGLSISQAENVITQRLSKYLQAPKVSVVRTDSAIEKRVTVEGEVRTPGVFPIKGNLSFLQAVAMAQGITELANSQKVLFYRDGAQHNVNLDLVRNGQIADPILRGDDRIVILKDPSKVREKKVLDYLPVLSGPLSIFTGG